MAKKENKSRKTDAPKPVPVAAPAPEAAKTAEVTSPAGFPATLTPMVVLPSADIPVPASMPKVAAPSAPPLAGPQTFPTPQAAVPTVLIGGRAVEGLPAKEAALLMGTKLKPQPTTMVWLPNHPRISGEPMLVPKGSWWKPRKP